MKKTCLSLLALLLSFLLIACGQNTSGPANQSGSQEQSGTNQGPQVQPETTAVETVRPTDAQANAVVIEDTFSVQTEVEEGYTVTDHVCLITKGGCYTLTGLLEGHIQIEIPSEDKIELILNGVSISSKDFSPILCLSADELSITASDSSYNSLSDERTAIAEEASNGALYAKCDLKLGGNGSLYVQSLKGQGVHSTDQLTVSEITLKVESSDHALKGNDGIKVKSGNIILVSSNADGLKTSNSDVSAKGNQRGTIRISGGILEITAGLDGIDAAFDTEIGGLATINITSGTAVGTSSSAGGGKGIKVDNTLSIQGGQLTINSKDDALHANNDVALASGENGEGSIEISGGTITLSAKDDGIHADNAVWIHGGIVDVLTSYEGIEGATITIDDGTIRVYATDDGLNATDGTSGGFGPGGGFNPGGGGRPGGGGGRPGFWGFSMEASSDDQQLLAGTSVGITINGGYVEVATPSGDTDAIDSNGFYTQTGGFVLVRGGSSSGNVAGSVDTDGEVTVTGGTIVAFGGICEVPTTSSCPYIAKSRQSFSKGDYQLTASDGTLIASFTLSGAYSSVWICSEQFSLKTAYTLSCNGTNVLTWTQSTQRVTA